MSATSRRVSFTRSRGMGRTFNNMKNVFYFTSKALVVFEILSFLYFLFP